MNSSSTRGNQTPCLEALAASGVHALQAVDPTRRDGHARSAPDRRCRMCLCGNVSCGCGDRQPEEVYAAAADLSKRAKTGEGWAGGSNASS